VLEENRPKQRKQKKNDPILRETEQFLRGYQLGKKLIAMDEYEKEVYGVGTTDQIWTPEQARRRMAQVRSFLLSLDNREEKLLLYLYYIRGESMERCAELLDLPRSTAYRMRKRALSLAAERWEEKRRAAEQKGA